MANRVVLQVDQAASAHQGFLRDFPERGQDPNLDRHIGIRPGGHPEKKARLGAKPLHNSTDFERHSRRADPHFTGLPGGRLQNRQGALQQPVVIIQLTTGQQCGRLYSYFSSSAVFTGLKKN